MRLSLAFLFLLCFGLASQGPVRAQEISAETALTPVIINDPEFGGKQAFTVNIPSGWQLEGTVVAGLGSNLPSPVFRAYSPDGLTEMHLLPALNWGVLNGESAQESLSVPPASLYLKQTRTAAQFLDRYVHSLGAVHVIGPVPIGTNYQQQFDSLLQQMNGSEHTNGLLKTTGDTAALRLEIKNGTFTLEERLRARVLCTEWTKSTTVSPKERCTARVDVLRAPQAKLDAWIEFADGHNLANARHDDAWLAELTEHMARTANPVAKPVFEQPRTNPVATSVLYRQAEDFGVMHEERVSEVEPMHARLSVSCNKDWADYALQISPPRDQTSAGKPVVEHTWASADGQRYSTCDQAANPNGILAGTWTDESTVSSETVPQ